MTHLSHQIAEARRQGDDEEVNSLRKQQTTLMNQLREDELKQIAADPSADRAVADLYLAKFASVDAVASDDDDPEIDDESAAGTQPTTRHFELLLEQRRQREQEMARELGPMLGQLPAPASEQPNETDQGAYGSCRSSDLLVDISLWAIDNPEGQTSEIAQWLLSRGCSKLRYDFGTSVHQRTPF